MEKRIISDGDFAVWYWRQWPLWPHPWERKLPWRWDVLNRIEGWLTKLVAD